MSDICHRNVNRTGVWGISNYLHSNQYITGLFMSGINDQKSILNHHKLVLNRSNNPMTTSVDILNECSNPIHRNIFYPQTSQHSAKPRYHVDQMMEPMQGQKSTTRHQPLQPSHLTASSFLTGGTNNGCNNNQHRTDDTSYRKFMLNAA